MKKTLLQLLLILTATASWAQLATLTDYNGTVVNESMVTHYGDHQTADQQVGVHVTLTASESKVVNMRRYELEVEPGSQNYFCWAVCYGPADAGDMPVWHADPQHALTLEPGVTASNFHAYHSPNDGLGTNTYRYVWFDVNDPTDSVWTDIRFVVTGVGISEAPMAGSLNVFPNPASANDVVNVSYEWRGAGAPGVVALRNLVGQVVRTQQISTVTGQFQLMVTGLPSGVYFATIESGDRILATHRVVLE